MIIYDSSTGCREVHERELSRTSDCSRLDKIELTFPDMLTTPYALS